MSSKTVSVPSTGSTSVGSKTSGNTKYYSSNSGTLLKGAVILCQHGFQGYEGTMTPLLENLKNNSFSSFYNCYFCNNVLKATEISTSAALTEMKNQMAARPESNIFVRTLFSDSKKGDVTVQANELFRMIKKVNEYCPSAPIVLVGYSKGGVVNLKCAIDHPGFIDKIINIGTPHTDTILQELIYIIRDILLERYGTFARIPVASKLIQKLVEAADNGIDKLLDGPVSYMNLESEWKKLSRKPTTTLIAGSAICLNGRESDFVVPRQSALAESFVGIKNRYEVDDVEVRVDTNVLRKVMGDASCILDALSVISELAIDVDLVRIVEVIVDIVANAVQNDGDFVKCAKLAHTKIVGDDYLLTHKTVGDRVFAGLNA